MLRVSGINVSYGGAHVLWDVSIDVAEGETVTVVGSNGAGKSTLLKTISGLVRPTTGEMTFRGQRIDGLPPYRIVEMGIAHIPEGRKLFPQLTVLENLWLGAYTKRAHEKKNETLEQVFKRFPMLRERQKQLACTLSGGEQQMLAIARGLMSQPELLVLDEPSLGLAPKLVMQVFDSIREIKQTGVEVLLVEQNVRHALELADRAYVLETGRVTLEGSCRELVNDEHVKKAYLGL
jgi:branched-chain amino acid transport system ATP-binding protein